MIQSRQLQLYILATLLTCSSCMLIGCRADHTCTNYAAIYSVLSANGLNTATLYTSACDFGFGSGQERQLIELKFEQKGHIVTKNIIEVDGDAEFAIEWKNNHTILIRFNKVADILYSERKIEEYSVDYTINARLAEAAYMKSVADREHAALEALTSGQAQMTGDRLKDQELLDADAKRQKEQYKAFYDWAKSNSAIQL